jgi:phosphoribosylglycinamide formyltransferase 1
MLNVVILISGRGSNMEAIVAATRRAVDPLPVHVRAVISNRPQAAGLKVAEAFGIATATVDHKAFADRRVFDAALAETVRTYAPDYVVLAGFMRVLGEAFLSQFPRQVLNIHPSLLPAFPGLRTHEAALAAGVRIAGATVHFVTAELDAGPAIIQAAVPVLANDTPASLSERVLKAEHQIYPAALAALARGDIHWAGDVLQINAPGVNPPNLYAPASI